MSAGAVGPAFDQSRTATASRPRDGFTRHAVDFQNIVPVDGHARDPIGRTARADAGIAAGIGERDFGGELIVLAEEQHRQLPDAGHVERFVERAVVDSAVSKKRRGHHAVPKDLRAVAAAAGLQQARTDDAAGPHHADLGGEEVHAAAASARTTGLASEQFGHQFARRHPFREGVPMSSMRGKDRVALGQMSTHARRDRFLSHVGVARSVDEPALVTPREFLFGLADDLHGSVKGEDRGQWGMGGGQWGWHR